MFCERLKAIFHRINQKILPILRYISLAKAGNCNSKFLKKFSLKKAFIHLFFNKSENLLKNQCSKIVFWNDHAFCLIY